MKHNDADVIHRAQGLTEWFDEYKNDAMAFTVIIS